MKNNKSLNNIIIKIGISVLCILGVLFNMYLLLKEKLK